VLKEPSTSLSSLQNSGYCWRWAIKGKVEMTNSDISTKQGIDSHSRITIKASTYWRFFLALLTMPLIYYMASCSESISSSQGIPLSERNEAIAGYYNNCLNTREYLHKKFPSDLSRKICECKADNFIGLVPWKAFQQGPDNPEGQRILDEVNKTCECRFAKESVPHYKGYSAGESVINELLSWGCI